MIALIRKLTTPLIRLSAAAICVAAACSEQTAVPRCLHLREVRRYGVFEPSTAADSAAVLGSVRGAIVGPGNRLFILDRSAHRVVAFRPDGTVDRVIPMRLTAITGFSVIDFDLRRITE